MGGGADVSARAKKHELTDLTVFPDPVSQQDCWELHFYFEFSQLVKLFFVALKRWSMKGHQKSNHFYNRNYYSNTFPVKQKMIKSCRTVQHAWFCESVRTTWVWYKVDSVVCILVVSLFLLSTVDCSKHVSAFTPWQKVQVCFSQWLADLFRQWTAVCLPKLPLLRGNTFVKEIFGTNFTPFFILCTGQYNLTVLLDLKSVL